MKFGIMGALLMMVSTVTAQNKTEVKAFNLAGPYAVTAPFAMDTVNVQGKKFDSNSLLGSLALTTEMTGTFTGSVLPSLTESKSVGLLSFYVNNTDYVKGKIEIKGPKHSKLYIDGVEASIELKLAPEHHTFMIQYLAEPSDTDSIRVTLDTSRPVVCQTTAAHPYMVHDLTDGKRVRGIDVSADGKYLSLSYQTTERGGNSRWSYELREVKSGKVLSHPSRNPQWMPKSSAWLEEEREDNKRVLYKVDPQTGNRERFAYNLPEGSYTIAPTEDYLIISCKEEGPKEDADVYEVLEMDDRQPGWRSRDYLSKYDIKTGITQRITFGNKGEYLSDISQNGSKLLIMSNSSRLSKRPTTVSNFFVMDAKTLKVDTILVGAEFLNSGMFSPDGSQILFNGTPEAFHRIGCQLPQDVTPSMIENELFLYDIATKQVTPLTKDFDPSVSHVEWSAADGQVYFSAEDKDYIHLYRLDTKSGKIQQMAVTGDYIYRWNMASHAKVMGWLCYNTMEPASAYVKSTLGTSKRGEEILLFDGKTALGDAELGTCEDYNYTNSKGDTVYGRLYLPKDFDASKKYPMIVYYYGGCSPTGRYFESPYAPQYWNSLGYVAYIVEPSGAAGFGQEWASRHVNTAGHGPAEDIIEGVKSLCATHPYINKEKIGCMGASYGGFMTQYLQTQTDIFAAAVSHAGIANHTSYWGQGYWGYNYSEVSMANSYPWSHRQLYVDQSPLFNADKIHTPLLLLHGDADTNVPLVESLQMFTALKLLGREVALVQVKGENHHILDYSKREKWLATQMAWFAKWLKDDSTWWDALYPKKNL